MTAPVKPLPAEDLGHVLAHTRELWTEARGQRFFITGGTGFFGMWLLESFARANDALALGMRAVVLTRDPAAFARKAPHLTARTDLEFAAGDVRTFVFPPGRFDYVIHAASDTVLPPPGADPAEIRDSIVQGTHHVLDFAAQAGVRKLLFTSSGAVYGVQPSMLAHLPEDYPGRPDPRDPGSGYGLGKLISEELCVAQAGNRGYECKLARCFAFVGPHLPLDAHFAIGNFIRNARRGEPIRVLGDGTPQRSYLYAADLAVWLWTLLFRAPAACPYNVGSDVGQAIVAHARCVSEVAGGELPVVVAIPPPDPAQPVRRYVPAIGRARGELGLTVWIPEAEGIRRTLAWLDGPAGDFSSPKTRAKAPN